MMPSSAQQRVCEAGKNSFSRLTDEIVMFEMSAGKLVKDAW
jgi:hypothetical protein